MFILILPQDNDVEEEEKGNYGSFRILFYLYPQTSSLFPSSWNQPPSYLNSVFHSHIHFSPEVQNLDSTLHIR